MLQKLTSFISHLFSFGGRIRRIEFLITHSILCFLAFCVLLTIEKNGLFVVFLIPLIWLILSTGAKRCQDFGADWYHQFIPFLWIELFTCPGDPDENEFGENPRNLRYKTLENE